MIQNSHANFQIYDKYVLYIRPYYYTLNNSIFKCNSNSLSQHSYHILEQ